MENGIFALEEPIFNFSYFSKVIWCRKNKFGGISDFNLFIENLHHSLNIAY